MHEQRHYLSVTPAATCRRFQSAGRGSQLKGSARRTRSNCRPGWRRIQLFLLGFCWVSVAVTFGEAESNAVSQFAGTKSRGIIIPIYTGENPEPGAVLHVERVFLDYERRGFFRIGLFPMVVGENVRFEVRQREAIRQGLMKLHEWFKSLERNQRFELRQVTFLFPGEAWPVVKAERARMSDRGRLRLLGGVEIGTATNTIALASAELQVTGPRAGRLTWRREGRTEVFESFEDGE